MQSQNSNLTDYVLYSKVGQGAYGTVYKAMHKESQTKVAIKVISLDREHKYFWNHLKLASREIEILYKLS